MKTIVITGGSDGLGKAIAKELSDNKIIIIGKDEEKLVSVSNELKCDYRVCDVTDYKSVDTTIKDIVNKYESIDVLINNAGVWLAGDLVENEYEKISKADPENLEILRDAIDEALKEFLSEGEE